MFHREMHFMAAVYNFSSMGETEGIFIEKLLLPPAFPASGQRRIPEQQLVGNPLAQRAVPAMPTGAGRLTPSTPEPALPLSGLLCPAHLPALPLSEARTAPSLPGEVIQPSHTAQLRLCKPSRQQVIFVLYKSIFGISVAFPATK